MNYPRLNLFACYTTQFLQHKQPSQNMSRGLLIRPGYYSQAIITSNQTGWSWMQKGETFPVNWLISHCCKLSRTYQVRLEPNLHVLQ